MRGAVLVGRGRDGAVGIIGVGDEVARVGGVRAVQDGDGRGEIHGAVEFRDGVAAVGIDGRAEQTAIGHGGVPGGGVKVHGVDVVRVLLDHLGDGSGGGGDGLVGVVGDLVGEKIGGVVDVPGDGVLVVIGPAAGLRGGVEGGIGVFAAVIIVDHVLLPAIGVVERPCLAAAVVDGLVGPPEAVVAGLREDVR